jgi:hypothetical protein
MRYLAQPNRSQCIPPDRDESAGLGEEFFISAQRGRKGAIFSGIAQTGKAAVEISE